MRVSHEFAENLRRNRAAADGHGFGRVVAHPDARAEMRRAADEPRIRAALRRAGLAADGLLAELRRLARAICDNGL